MALLTRKYPVVYHVANDNSVKIVDVDDCTNNCYDDQPEV